MKLIRKGFDKDLINSHGLMFLIGNGHLGYRGTLEEFKKEDHVAFNIVGLYDQYRAQWRESVNAFNPFYLKVEEGGIELNIKHGIHLEHEQSVDMESAIFARKTEYKNLIFRSQRFLSSNDDEVFGGSYQFEAKAETEVSLCFGIDTDIFEVSGPHYTEIKKRVSDNVLYVSGRTNEGHLVSVALKFVFNFAPSEVKIIKQDGLFVEVQATIKEKGMIRVDLVGKVKIDEPVPEIVISEVHNLNYLDSIIAHRLAFNALIQPALVKIHGDEIAQEALNFAIYQTMILGSTKRRTSIPARGLSGQTYKGAIFWDTEVFLLPFFLAQNKEMAINLLNYRVDALAGAKVKAQHYGYAGAYYAWEGQEDGKEACSEYNVTDALSGEPIRTYFVDKQIHISIDVVFGFLQYYRQYRELDLYLGGGLEIFLEVMKFYRSYATFNSKQQRYELRDVLGPDEYHERVNNNAFTNYMIYFCALETLNALKALDGGLVKEFEIKCSISLQDIADFVHQLYLPPIDPHTHLIEQFDGYFALEDVQPEVLKERLKDAKEYWGGPNGVATHTRVIKQADVVCLLALFPEHFEAKVLKANYDFYLPYTEHGSSLSKTMYGIVASRLGHLDSAYQMLIESASIDMGTNHKEWAGTIYIGGSHPASNAGAYLILTRGLSGLNYQAERLEFNCSQLPKAIEGIEYTINYLNKREHISLGNGGKTDD